MSDSNICSLCIRLSKSDTFIEMFNNLYRNFVISIIYTNEVMYRRKKITKNWSLFNDTVWMNQIIRTLTCTIKPIIKSIAMQETISAWFCIINSWLNIGGFLLEFFRPFIATIFVKKSVLLDAIVLNRRSYERHLVSYYRSPPHLGWLLTSTGYHSPPYVAPGLKPCDHVQPRCR